MLFDIAVIDKKGKTRVMDTRVPQAVLKTAVKRLTARGKHVEVTHHE